MNVVVSDGQSQSNVFQVSVNVISVNDPPSITLPDNRMASENSLYSEVLQVQDVDAGDVVSLTPHVKTVMALLQFFNTYLIRNTWFRLMSEITWSP